MLAMRARTYSTREVSDALGLGQVNLHRLTTRRPGSGGRVRWSLLEIAELYVMTRLLAVVPAVGAPKLLAAVRLGDEPPDRGFVTYRRGHPVAYHDVLRLEHLADGAVVAAFDLAEVALP